MTLILDAAPLVALANLNDRQHAALRTALSLEEGPLVVPAPVTAEVDYLLGRRHGGGARRAFLEDLAQGRFIAPCLEVDDYATVGALESRYADLDPGLADLSVVVMANRFGTRRVLTFDERDFRTLRPLGGGSFTLLPADL